MIKKRIHIRAQGKNIIIDQPEQIKIVVKKERPAVINIDTDGINRLYGKLKKKG